MARKVRIQYPGAIYHVMSRGDHREAIFQDDQDRQQFLGSMEECCQKTGWQIHSFCLMSNHFHLVIETPQANLVEGMKWFLGVYTSRFNRRHHLCGHLFSSRYKALMVDGTGHGYLKTVCDYVHLNPVRAMLLRPEEPLKNYRWSSYPSYLLQGPSRPAWLRVDRLLGEWAIPWDHPNAGQQFAAAMEARRLAELEQEYKPLRRGWCLGSKEFRIEMLAYIEKQHGKWHYGIELSESGEAKAERLIQESFRAEGVTEQQVANWRKSHPLKMKLAEKLRAETTVTISWIAQRLSMGTNGYLAHLLCRPVQAGTQNPLANQPTHSINSISSVRL